MSGAQLSCAPPRLSLWCTTLDGWEDLLTVRAGTLYPLFCGIYRRPPAPAPRASRAVCAQGGRTKMLHTPHSRHRVDTSYISSDDTHTGGTADVLHPDHAPPPGKTDTHFTVRRQYVEACSCCGGGCRWGMVVEPSQKNWHPISPIELRARTYIMPCIMRPDPAVESSRFGNQIPKMVDRYKWVRPFRPDLGDALAMGEHI
mmetsp:Transcript_31290/g.76965  ORF Transcript_31290/g.76965 Transcript_31290/m.76965 type:complete len:201 (+) Transcript_31290:983-1585(+)